MSEIKTVRTLTSPASKPLPKLWHKTIGAIKIGRDFMLAAMLCLMFLLPVLPLLGIGYIMCFVIAIKLIELIGIFYVLPRYAILPACASLAVIIMIILMILALIMVRNSTTVELEL